MSEFNELKQEVIDENKIPKHLRARYWHSWEEMRLVELWRLYNDEVVTLQKNLPVFRKMCENMREIGFNMSSQACRRKINTLKNRYIRERRRIEGKYEPHYTVSDWKIYPLIHCIMVPRKKKPNLKHETEIVNQLLSKLKPPSTTVENTISTIPMTTTNAAISTDTVGTTNYLITNITTTPMKTCSTASPNIKPVINGNLPTLNQHPATTPQRRTRCSRIAKTTHGVNFILQYINQSSLEQLRADNHLLEEQREEARQRLEIEEKECELFQTCFQQWIQQQEQVLQSLQSVNPK